MNRFAVLGLAAFAVALLPGATPPKAGEIAVTVTDLRSAKGVVRACLTSQADGFPRCRQDAAALETVVPAANGRVQFIFTNVKPGRYAVALLHDENGNGKADRALGMMPKEGFGFSRDAKVTTGPPKFDAAAFDYGGEASTLTIRMRYML